MSFNFDDDPSDDDDIDLDAFDDTGLLALSYRQEEPAVAAAAASMPVSVSELNADDDESDIDWEDADQDADNDASFNAQNDIEDDLDRKLPALPTHGVTVTFSSTTNTPLEVRESIEPVNETSPKQSEQTKKRKRTTVRVLKDVPYHMQQLILGVRRSHLLCSLAHSVRCSSICTAASTSQMSPSHYKEEEESRAMLLNMAYSLVPSRFHSTDSEEQASDTCARKYNMPTNQQLQDFSQWFFDFINAGSRRRETIRQNLAQGAARQSNVSTKRSRKSSAGSKRKHSKQAERNVYEPDINPSYSQGIPTTHDLIEKLEYLSPYYDTDPQLFINDGVDVIGLVENINPLEKVLLFLAMSRSLGWRARFVSALDPLPLQLTVDHPLLEFNTKVGHATTGASSNQYRSILRDVVRLMEEGGVLRNTESKKLIESRKDTELVPFRNGSKSNICWVEVLCNDNESKHKQSNHVSKIKSNERHSVQPARWVPIFPHQKRYDAPLDAEIFIAQLDEEAQSNTLKQPAKYKKPSSQSRKAPKRKYVSYVLASEHFQSPNRKSMVRLTDVTPRYSSTWSQTLRLRGATGRELSKSGGKCVDLWWSDSLKAVNSLYRSSSSRDRSKSNCESGAKISSVKSPTPVTVTKTQTHNGKTVEVLEIASSSEDETPKHLDSDQEDDIDHEETKQLSATISQEPMPKSKAGFKQHPQYVIPSVLNSTEVLHPDARKHICGVFKGEMVYRRKDVSNALRAKKWLYQGRKVKEKELRNPVKKVKARKKQSSKGFQLLDSYVDSNEKSFPTKYCDDEEEMDSLYGIWQTKKWAPPAVGPSDEIPVNEYKNVELALINPGLIHMEQPRLSVVARRLGIPYAPCMLGYEGHNGNQTPTIRGIVVHEHNVELLNEAYLEYQSQQVESEVEARRQSVLKKWERLVQGILVKDRLDRAYG